MLLHTLNDEFHYAECCYSECFCDNCHYNDFRNDYWAVMSVLKQSAIMLSVFILSGECGND